MKERKSYVGSLHGVNGIWCDECPNDVEVNTIITFFTPDEGKVFTKDGELFDSVTIMEGVDINDYVEIVDPRQEEQEPQEEGEPNE